MARTWSMVKELLKEPMSGPKSFCTGTLLPCEASNRCHHFGIHNCSTFKKHSRHPCPHYPTRGFICTRLDYEDDKKVTKAEVEENND